MAKTDGKIIISSTKKLALSGMAGFGDADDIFNDKTIKSKGGTIIFEISVRREFLPGNYDLHILEVNPENQAQAAILCRDDVDPLKIHQLFVQSDTSSDFRCSNYVNRYDWMHSRWIDEETYLKKESKFKGYLTEIFTNKFGVEPQNAAYELFFELVFFVNAENIAEISKAEFTIEKQNDYVYAMLSEQENVIGFIIHVPEDSKIILGEWKYACLLQDKCSGKYFSFIFQDQYACRWNWDDMTDLKKIGGEINFTFDIKDFLRDQ